MSTGGVDSIPDQFLLCRDLQHSWAPYDAKIVKQPGQRREVHRILRCIRCETLKTQRLSTDGSILGHSYNYPEGYLTKGQGRLSARDRARVRKINIEQQRSR